jgi:hypothetical protein
MKSLRDYITESEQWIDSPVVGDDFGINIREECLLESHILEVSEDAIVIEADDRMLEMLKSYGMLGEEELAERIQRYGAVGSNRAQGFTVAEGDIDPNRHPQTRDYGTGHPQPPMNDPWDYVSDRSDSKNPQPPMKDPWDYVQDSESDFRRVLELAGVPNAANNDPLAAKAADLAPVGTEQDPRTATTIDEGVMSSIDMDLRHIARTRRMDALVDAMRGEFGMETQQYLQHMMDDVEHDLEQRGQRLTDMKTKLGMLMDRIQEIYAGQDLDEAEYQGREVPLGKPMQGDVKKKKVYVRKPNGNVVKVEFGDKTMRIKKSNPKRRKSFRARHNCANPGPRWKARYWSCKAW